MGCRKQPPVVASLQPHHPARAMAEQHQPGPNPLQSGAPARRSARLFFTFSAKVTHSVPAGSLTPLSRQLSSNRLIQASSSSPRAPQVAAHKAPPEDPSRQFLRAPPPPAPDVLRRHLGHLADGLDRHTPLFALPPQLLAECRHSALSRHVSRQPLLAPYHKRLKGQIKGI